MSRKKTLREWPTGWSDEVIAHWVTCDASGAPVLNKNGELLIEARVSVYAPDGRSFTTVQQLKLEEH